MIKGSRILNTKEILNQKFKRNKGGGPEILCKGFQIALSFRCNHFKLPFKNLFIYSNDPEI